MQPSSVMLVFEQFSDEMLFYDNSLKILGK
jgi:hypothetical protein